MSNKVYDVLKNIVQIVLPAIVAFISAIFTIWNIPYGTEIAGTISAITVFLGAMLKISSINYYKKGDKQ